MTDIDGKHFWRFLQFVKFETDNINMAASFLLNREVYHPTPQVRQMYHPVIPQKKATPLPWGPS